MNFWKIGINKISNKKLNIDNKIFDNDKKLTDKELIDDVKMKIIEINESYARLENKDKKLTKKKKLLCKENAEKIVNTLTKDWKKEENLNFNENPLLK